MKKKLAKQLTKYRYRLLYGALLLIFGLSFPPLALIGLFGLTLILSFVKREEWKYLGTVPVKNGDEVSGFVVFQLKTYVYMPFFLKYLSVFHYRPVCTSYAYLANCGDPQITADEAESITPENAVIICGKKLVEISEEEARAFLNDPGNATPFQRALVSAFAKGFTDEIQKFVDDGLVEVLYRSAVFAILRLPHNIYGITPYCRSNDGSRLCYLVDQDVAELFLNAPEKWSHFLFHSKEYPNVYLRAVGLTESLLKYFAQLPPSDSAPDLKHILWEKNREEMTRYMLIEKLAKEKDVELQGNKWGIGIWVFWALIGIAGFSAAPLLAIPFTLCTTIAAIYKIKKTVTLRKTRPDDFMICIKTVKKTSEDADESNNSYFVYFTDGCRMEVKEEEFSQFYEGDDCYVIMVAFQKKPWKAFSKRRWKFAEELRPYFRGDPADF